MSWDASPSPIRQRRPTRALHKTSPLQLPKNRQLAGQGGACVADRLRVVSQGYHHGGAGRLQAAYLPVGGAGRRTGRLTLDSGSNSRASSGIQSLAGAIKRIYRSPKKPATGRQRNTPARNGPKTGQDPGGAPCLGGARGAKHRAAPQVLDVLTPTP